MLLRPSARTLVAALLGASLALNLVLGGLLLWKPAQPRAGRGFDRMVARIEASLPEADRPRFHAVLVADRDRYAGALAAMRAASAEVDAVMRREPYDAAALRNAMAAWSERWVAFNAAFTETLVHAMGEVSPQGRAQVAARRQGG